MTLTEASAFTKKGLIVGTLTLFVFSAAWGIWHYYYNYIYLPSLPPVEEQPTLIFGPLPKVAFPESSVSSANFSYSMDTETGALPEGLPKLFKVYSIAQLATDLLALDRAKSLAGILGFSKNPQAITATQYKFIDEKIGGELIVDLDTGNFKFRRSEATGSGQNYERIEDFIDESIQTQNLKSFLSSRSLLKNQLQEGRTTVVYNNPVKKDSTLATINLWQADIDETPIVTPKFREALIKAIGNANRDNDKKYILMDYVFWPIDLENFATYPIKTAEEAYQELTNGEGFVAIEPRSSSASITKVYLAYYLSEEYANYLQPVYVFEGPDFVGMIQAVKSEYVEKTN